MNELPHLSEIFNHLKRGSHLGPDDQPLYSSLAAHPNDYINYFAPLGLRLIRHERDFFYFEPETPDNVPETMPRIAAFSYILIDHAANQPKPIEDFLFGQTFLVSALPHFTLDRYVALLRQVGVHDVKGLTNVLSRMEAIGWAKWTSSDEFRLLRPFHRVLSKCLELAELAQQPQPPEQTT